MKNWLITGALIVGVWVLAAGIIFFARSRQPTAASITAYVNSVDLNSLSSDKRAKAIARVEDMVNRITFDERQTLDHDHVTHDFFNQLTDEEKGAYLDATLPAGFQQLMESFNKMAPEERKHIVENALNRMKQNPGNGPGGGDPAIAQHVIDQGLKSFYKDASADTKLDLAPLVEQMQINIQGGGR